jgi:transcription elongation factor GreA
MVIVNQADTAYVTPGGLARIERELADLKEVKRPEIVERLHDAQGGGDGIDNTELLSVQEELALIDGRIQELAYILRHVQLIKPGTIDGIIRLGSVVVIQEEGVENVETYTIVGSTEASPMDGLISEQSPLGRAILNHTIGDNVEVHAPGGLMRFRIIAVT